MDNDHLVAPMLSASMDEVIRLRTRNEALEAALREITDKHLYADQYRAIARAALNQQNSDR